VSLGGIAPYGKRPPPGKRAGAVVADDRLSANVHRSVAYVLRGREGRHESVSAGLLFFFIMVLVGYITGMPEAHPTEKWIRRSKRRNNLRAAKCPGIFQGTELCVHAHQRFGVRDPVFALSRVSASAILMPIYWERTRLDAICCPPYTTPQWHELLQTSSSGQAVPYPNGVGPQSEAEIV